MTYSSVTPYDSHETTFSKQYKAWWSNDRDDCCIERIEFQEIVWFLPEPLISVWQHMWTYYWNCSCYFRLCFIVQSKFCDKIQKTRHHQYPDLLNGNFNKLPPTSPGFQFWKTCLDKMPMLSKNGDWSIEYIHRIASPSLLIRMLNASLR